MRGNCLIHDRVRQNIFFLSRPQRMIIFHARGNIVQWCVVVHCCNAICVCLCPLPYPIVHTSNSMMRIDSHACGPSFAVPTPRRPAKQKYYRLSRVSSRITLSDLGDQATAFTHEHSTHNADYLVALILKKFPVALSTCWKFFCLFFVKLKLSHEFSTVPRDQKFGNFREIIFGTVLTVLTIILVKRE